MSRTPENPDSEQALQWEHGWDEHERFQLQRMARLPLSEKLAWLEEAHRLVMRISKSDDREKET
jgi:hypothetical protein